MRPRSAGPVIDFAAGAGQDRFSPPKASILFSPTGLKQCGLPDRPACRVLRYAAGAESAAANAAAEARQAAKPGGRRHNAFQAYLGAVRHNEAQWGLDTMQARSGKRCTATVFAARLGSSAGVAPCMTWHPDAGWGQRLGPGDHAAAAAQRTPPRPSTAPAASPSSPTRFLNFHDQAACGAVAPRFKSRAEFEQRRCATPDAEAAKRRGYLALHQQRKAAAADREAREAGIIQAWPHGCPTRVLRDARAEGLNPPALQHGVYDGPRISRSPPRSC